MCLEKGFPRILRRKPAAEQGRGAVLYYSCCWIGHKSQELELNTDTHRKIALFDGPCLKGKEKRENI